MKRLLIVIVPMLMVVMLMITQCNSKSEVEQNEIPSVETVVPDDDPENEPGEITEQCEDIYYIITLNLKYPDGQPVLLDSCTVFWVSQNRFLVHTWSEFRAWGSYNIVGDGMQLELENKSEIMRFTGYLNGEIVCERDVLVGADRCHVQYLGSESLTQVLPRNTCDEQEDPDANIEITENDELAVFSLHRYGGWIGLDEKMRINADSTHYSINYRVFGIMEPRSFQTAIKTSDEQWNHLTRTFNMKSFTKIKNGSCRACVDGYDEIFSVTKVDKTYSVYNGKNDDHYQLMQDFFDSIYVQLSDFEIIAGFPE